MKSRSILFAGLFFISIVGVLYYLKLDATIASTGDSSFIEYVNAEQFGANGEDQKDDSKAIQKAIDYSHAEKIGEVKLSGNKQFILKSGLVLKEEVELELGQNTRLYIDGDFRVIEIEKNASITNGIFEITDQDFESEVIYLDGKQKFWSWERTQIKNVAIINSSGSNKGTGISLFTGGADQFISFVNFQDINISGVHTGVRMEAKPPEKGENGYSFINGNRFNNLTLDGCINCIEVIGSVTVPNECSGIEFKGVQVQITNETESVFKLNGSDNQIEAMIWDVHLSGNRTRHLVTFTNQSTGNSLFSNLESTYIKDEGIFNYYTSPRDEN